MRLNESSTCFHSMCLFEMHEKEHIIMKFAWELGIPYFVVSLLAILAIYAALIFVLVKSLSK